MCDLCGSRLSFPLQPEQARVSNVGGIRSEQAIFGPSQQLPWEQARARDLHRTRPESATLVGPGPGQEPCRSRPQIETPREAGLSQQPPLEQA